VVLFYKRIFSTRTFKTVANVVMSVVGAFMVSSFFVSRRSQRPEFFRLTSLQAVLFCARDVSTFWTTPAFLDGSQYVINLSAIITAFAAIDILLDLVILVMPLPMIKSMQLSTRKKFFVAGILLLGSL
jgi:hypothetical protein